MQHRWTVLLLGPIALGLSACADGGTKDTPQSQVAIAAEHHLFSLRSLRGFGTFPVPADAVETRTWKLNLFDDSTYTLTTSSGTSAPDRYALENDGTLSIYVAGFGNEPSQIFLGGYSLGAGQAQPDLFFTDRVSSPNSQRIGLFYGTRVVQGQVELAGAWHVLSLHVVFDQTILSPENVGRGAHGGVSIATGAPGDARAISGTGMQGTSSLTFSGSIRYLLDAQGNGDGTVNLSLGYQLTGQAVDTRVLQAAASERVVFALDENSGDGEAGLVTLVRKFDAPTTPVDSVRVPGTFLVGGHTLFINPSNSGSDTFVGVVTLTPQGGFRLDATGNNGADFTYTGSYALAADGGMTISIDGTNETWFAAIDTSYNSFALIDDFEELRPNNIPELNFAFGVRRQEN